MFLVRTFFSAIQHKNTNLFYLVLWSMYSHSVYNVVLSFLHRLLGLLIEKIKK